MALWRSGSEPGRWTRRPLAACTPGCAAVLADWAQGCRQQPGGLVLANAGDAQDEAWDAITQAAADAGGGSKPLSFSNVVLLASATA